MPFDLEAVETPARADRDGSGRFVRGNTAAVTHGARSSAFWRAAAARVEEIAIQIIHDHGHALESAPEGLRTAAYATARAALVEEGTFARVLDSGGTDTSSGRGRSCAARWQSASANLKGWLGLVGLQKVPRPVDPMEAVRRKVAEVNQ